MFLVGTSVHIPLLHACSLSPFRTYAESRSVFVLGRAGTDTLFAGAGDVAYSVQPGHYGGASARDVYGLITHVERVVGPAAARLPAGVTKVLLVPWDYGADCKPTPYAQSARWVEEGRRGIYTARLRAESLWVSGIPTLDVFAAPREPYAPGAPAPDALRRIPADSMLSLDDVLQVLGTLPEFASMQRDADAATRALFAWARANPSQAMMYPVSYIIRTIVYQANALRLRTVQHPAIGTYRLTVAVNGTPAATVFARTMSTPSSGNWFRPTTRWNDRFSPPPYDTYDLYSHLADSEASLPAVCQSAMESPQAYFSVKVRPEADSQPRGATYLAQAEMYMFARVFPRDTALRTLVRPSDSVYSARSERDELHRIPGAIRIGINGEARLFQQETMADGRRISVVGVRVSAVTVRCPSE